MLLHRLARLHDWRLLELPVDDDSRLDLDGLTSLLSDGLDLVVLPHISSHRGIVQPAAAAGRLCRAAGVPLVLDVCQSLGHVDVGGTGATAYVGTSRKWLAGPRGVGFLIVPGLAEYGEDMDAAVPALDGHAWVRGDPSHRWPARPATRPPRGRSPRGSGWASPYWNTTPSAPPRSTPAWPNSAVAARRLLDGVGGWRAVEPLDEPSALVTLRPPPGAEPATAVEDARSRAAKASLLVGVVPVGRAPADLPTPVLRISPSPGPTRRTCTPWPAFSITEPTFPASRLTRASTVLGPNTVQGSAVSFWARRLLSFSATSRPTCRWPPRCHPPGFPSAWCHRPSRR